MYRNLPTFFYIADAHMTIQIFLASWERQSLNQTRKEQQSHFSNNNNNKRGERKRERERERER